MTTSLGWLLIVLAAGSHTKTVLGGENCEDPDRLIVCHVETTLHPSTDPCYCTHLVIHNPHDTEIVKAAEKLREKNRRLKIVSLSTDGKSGLMEDSVSGVYLKLSKTLTKEQVVKNVKILATELDNLQASKRASAKYSPDNAETASKNVAEILLELPSSPELLAKNYDLKSLNKFVNYFIITSDNLTDSSEEGLAYHPSRLMGIDDILNADSLVDLISGLGAEHEKILISLPATALKFNLKDKNDNMPRAKVIGPPESISQQDLCSLIENGLWTLERDEDLTAPYAYSNTTWLAFDDSVSAAIKAKYILLRGLAGISVTKSESDDWSHACASRPILDTIYGTFTNLVRKPRAATLLSLQDQIHNSITPFAGDVQLSPYRIVRVVDRAGSVHVVRKEAKTEFQCSRQGYFTHPSGCNRFYRCVKFNQYSSDFTVFEYDCPAGLAFDERYEVCVWPGSLPDASACKGSSEIAPVPRSRFACTAQGYFADPENCRWFFACLDHHGDGSPPTAYEFRCPFGLVFNEGTLTCDWPWSVPGCGSGAAIHSSAIYPGDILEGRLRPAYAQVSDVHVSGGRIANVDGGHVLGTNLLSGISASGQRYSTGYSLGLANQINSAFGSSKNEDNSGAYIHDPTGDTGGEYIHQEGPQGPGSSYVAEKDSSYLNVEGASGNNLQYATGGQYGAGGASGAYLHDSRGDVGGQYAHIGGLSGLASYATSSGASGSQYGAEGVSGAYVHDSRGDFGGKYSHIGGSSGLTSYATSSGASGSQYGTGGAYVHDSRGDVGGQYAHIAGASGSSSYEASSGTSRGQYTAGGASGAYEHDSRGNVGENYHIGGSVDSLALIDSSGTSGSHLTAGDGISVHGTTSLGLDNAGAYLHDSRGDVGGQYNHVGGSSGSSSSYIAPSSVSGVQYGAGDASGAYIHDSRGDFGGQYAHVGGSSVSSSYEQSSGSSESQHVAGDGILVYGTKSSGLGNTGTGGAYVHDSRGDVAGQYAHIGGSSGSSSSGASEGQYTAGGASGGQYLAGGTSGTYAHDSRGDVGGQYAYIGGSTGSSSSYIASSGASEGQYTAGGASGGQYLAGGTSGTYLHDSRGNVGGQFAQVGGSTGTSSSYISSSGGAGAYVHDSREHQVKGYEGSATAGGVTIPTGHGYLSNSQNLAGIGGYSGGSYSSSSASGEYIHDSRGDSGGEYIHQGGRYPSYGGIYAGGYAGHHIHGSDGAYVHDVSGDKAEPYIHQEGPSGPLYHDLNGENIYKSQYASKYTGQYVSKYSADYDQLTHHDNVNSAGTIYFQPQGGVIHTYDSSRLHAQPLGFVGSVKTHSVSPIQIAKFSGTPLNPVQYSAPGPHASYEYNVIKTQTVSPLTASAIPSASYGNIQPINSVKTHVVQPIQVSTPRPIISYEQPIIRTQTVRPITVTSSPVIPFNSIQYQHPLSVLKTVPERYESHRFSTITSPIIKTDSVQPVAITPAISQPVLLQGNSLNYQQRIVSSTPSPLVESYHFNEGIQTGTVRPITVTSAPAIPFNPVQYGQKTVASTAYSGYDYSKPKLTFSYPQHVIKNQVVVKQPVLPLVGYSYHPSVSVPAGNAIINQPVLKTNVVSPVVVSSTPKPEYISHTQPVVKTQSVKFSTVTSSPILPYNPVQYETRVHTYGVTTPATPVIAKHPYNPIINTVHPVIVASTPAIPLNPVQYGVKAISSSVGYQYPKPAVGLSYPKDKIYSTQAPPVISYTYQKPVIKTQPIQPVLVSTPAQPVVDYSYEQSVEPAHSAVSYSQKQINSAIPIAISTPAPPVVRYSVKTRPIQPIIVNSTPAVPLNPVQYVNPVSVSTPSPQLVSYSFHQPIKPAVPIAVSSPAPPVVSYSYEQPAVSSPAHPVSYSVRAKPIQPIVVSSTPAIPFNPVHYVNSESISTPSPPLINYSYQQPIKPAVPVSFSAPALPAVKYSYKQPIVPISVPAQAAINTRPIHPIVVSSTPAVPLNPVQYVNPITISTPAPSVIANSFRQPIVPISASTPSPPIISYSYQQPIKPAIPLAVGTSAPSTIKYSFKTRPIKPIVVSSTPAVPLNPVQYFSTPAPPLVRYSHEQPINPSVPIAFNRPSQPIVDYSYTQTIKPVLPSVNYAYQQPIIPIAVSTTPSPPVSYPIKAKPIQPIIVSSTPAVPLNPVQYINPVSVSTPAPPLIDYSYRQSIKPVVPISATTPSPPIINYSYQQPVKPAPFSFVHSVESNQLPSVSISSTPAPPLVNYSYQKPISPVALSTPTPFTSYSFKARPVQSISVSSTPVVPFNPIQYEKTYSTPAPPVNIYSYRQPDVPISVSTPSPIVNYSYENKRYQTITAASTPEIPFNPVQFVRPVTQSTPAPPTFEYSYKQPIKHVTPSVTYSTHATPSVDYSYEKPMEQYAVNKATNVVFSYTFDASPRKPVTVSSTPAIPLNPVQYSVTPAPAVSYQPTSTYSTPVIKYSYRQPVTNEPYHPTLVTTNPKLSYTYQEEPEYFLKTKTARPISVTRTPVVPLNPVQYFSTTTPQPTINYKYQSPLIKTHSTVVAPSTIDYYDEEFLHRDIEKLPAKPIVNSFYEVPIRTTTLAPITVTSTPRIPYNPVQYYKTPIPLFNYKSEIPQGVKYNSKGCCSSPSLSVATPTPNILKAIVTQPTTISPPARKPVVGAYFEENYEANRHEQGYVYSRPNIRLEERPIINQGIYTTVSPSTTPAEVTSSVYLQRPVQTYANTVEEESYISNTPDHVSTLVNQPVSVDTSDEDLNVHLDIPKIGINRPAYTISNAPQQQIVEVTTVTPVVKRVRLQGGGLTKGGYYVRRQKVKVQPILTTTENYPSYFTSTAKPIYSSTIDLTSPTLYSTTFRPSTVYSASSTTFKDNELEVEDVDDDEKLLAQVSGQFGDIINAGNQGIIRQGFSSTTVSSLKDGETIVGVVKKERTEGGRKKTKVVVVSKLSDFNPLLVGKLGAECSCKSNSKTLNLRRGSSQTRGQLFYPEEQNVPIPSREYLPSSPEPPKIKSYYLPSSEVPNSDTIASTTIKSFNYENEPFVEIKPVNKVQRLFTTTGSSTDYINTEYDITTKKSTFSNRIGISQEKTKGASFDRYGPGGLRGSDETLQGSVDCQRPGLFRHPKYCNKFYACNWDQWKKRFTLHVFNCPIHLAYDSQLGACNWPSKGPACADDNLLV